MKKMASIIFASIFIFSCDSSSNSSRNITTINNLNSILLDNIESGSNIKLDKGTYELDNTIRIFGKENITIDGNNATLIMRNMAADVIYIRNSNNITLMNFKATHIEPKGPTGCTGNVIHIEGGANILIEKCDLNGSGIVGIAAYNTKNLTVSNNFIHKNSQYGIIYQGPQIEIKENVFEKNTMGNIYFSYNDNSWPPNEKINTNQNKEGLKMSNNIFKRPEQMMSDVISILSSTSYGAGDVDPNIVNMTWVGLFSNGLDNSIKCYTTKLNTKPIHSPMDDEDGEMSGIRIYCEGHDKDPILLISGIAIPQDVKIDSYNTLKNSLMPGESMQLGNCIIKAFGAIGQYGQIIDYQLTITGEKNGEKIEQIFLEQAGFDDAMIHFIWTGDIDQDGFPDLYMDISNKYSFSNPALFLSSKAGKNELLKLVAEDQLFGC